MALRRETIRTTVTIDDFEIDVARLEDHSFDSLVTEHPVEEGADVADHVRAAPVVIALECIVSDTPLGLLADRRGDGVLPSEDAFSRLLQIRDAREPVTIETSLGVFKNMVLRSLSVPRSSDTGFALRFRATFQQVELVTNDRTTVAVAVPRAKKKRNLGNKPAPPAPSADPATKGATPPSGKTKSLLTQIGEGTGWW